MWAQKRQLNLQCVRAFLTGHHRSHHSRSRMFEGSVRWNVEPRSVVCRHPSECNGSALTRRRRPAVQTLCAVPIAETRNIGLF